MRKSLPRKILGIMLIVISVLAVAQSYRTTTAHRNYVRCQANINDALIERTRILTEVAAGERAAQRARDDALDAALTDPSLLKRPEERTPQETARVRELYLVYRTSAGKLAQERAAGDRARVNNPVPAPPSQVCG